MAYWTKVSDIERHKAACHCADKVSDGSDADAFIMVRSDQDVYDFIHTHFV